MVSFNFCPACSSRLRSIKYQHGFRNACPDKECGFIEWDNPVPVVAAIVEHQSQIVLANNTNWPNGMFGLIAGYLEKGESPDQAILREIKEELNLDAEYAELIGNFSFIPKNQIMLGYYVKAEGVISLNDELSEWKYIEPDQLKSWKFGAGQIVEAWLAQTMAG